MARRKFRFRFRFIVEEEYQPLRVVPLLLWLALAGSLAMQVIFSVYLLPPPQARAAQLPPPPEMAPVPTRRIGGETVALAAATAGQKEVSTMQAAAFGAEVALGKLLMLRLQTFDNQPGISIPFRELDYERLAAWLDAIVALDERAAYPHLHGARVYTDVPDNARRRLMIEWVRRQFLKDPKTRWEWLAHCVTLARHRLDDLPYALELARLLRENTAADEAPGWARQMEIFLREDMDEFESAAALLAALLKSGEAQDPHEFNFLYTRLKRLLNKALGGGEEEIPLELMLSRYAPAIQADPSLRQKFQTLIDLEGRYIQAQEEIAR